MNRCGMSNNYLTPVTGTWLGSDVPHTTTDRSHMVSPEHVEVVHRELQEFPFQVSIHGQYTAAFEMLDDAFHHANRYIRFNPTHDDRPGQGWHQQAAQDNAGNNYW